MTNETVPKDILDKLNAGIVISGVDLDIRDLTSASDSVEVLQDTAADLKTEVHNPAGVLLSVGGYGSSDGGTTWYPIKVDASGVVSTDATITDPWKAVVDNGTRIQVCAFANIGLEATIYTVPANKVLYIIQATMSVRNTEGTTGADSSYMKIDTSNFIEAYTWFDTVENLVQNFTLPLRLVAGEAVKVDAGAECAAIGCIIGYLVDA